MKRLKPTPKRICARCRTTLAPMLSCEGGFVCESCLDTTLEGRDNTSRALKAQRRAGLLERDQTQGVQLHMSPDEVEYAVAADRQMAETLAERSLNVPSGSGGEVIDQGMAGLRNTLTDPTIAAVEASARRTDLLTMVGNDIAALALDAADTIQAENSMEKMLAHQLAAIHSVGMQMIHRANLTEDPLVAAKLIQTAMKGFATYQSGIAALKQLRGSPKQHILVQHVNVETGGQAVVGTVNAGGGLQKCQ